MKECIFIIKRSGNDRNGNKIFHIYAAWKYAGDNWVSFAPSTLKSLGMGRVVRGEYITTNMYDHEIVVYLNKIYKDKKHSFIFL